MTSCDFVALIMEKNLKILIDKFYDAIYYPAASYASVEYQPQESECLRSKSNLSCKSCELMIPGV
jgi:hypothetical protein